MAMVTIRILLPTNEEIKRLAAIVPPLRIAECRFRGEENLPRTPDRHAALFLCSNNDRFNLKVEVEYRQVLFKFEIFSLAISTMAAVPTDLIEVGRIERWDQIDCVLAFEWERPAATGEVPADWQQIVARRGLRGEIADTATAIGVSMVGIVFRNSITTSPAGMLYTDSDDPCSLLLSCDANEIGRFTKNCELVTIEDFPRWKRDLKRWSVALGADQQSLATPP